MGVLLVTNILKEHFLIKFSAILFLVVITLHFSGVVNLWAYRLDINTYLNWQVDNIRAELHHNKNCQFLFFPRINVERGKKIEVTKIENQYYNYAQKGAVYRNEIPHWWEKYIRGSYRLTKIELERFDNDNASAIYLYIDILDSKGNKLRSDRFIVEVYPIFDSSNSLVGCRGPDVIYNQ